MEKPRCQLKLSCPSLVIFPFIPLLSLPSPRPLSASPCSLPFPSVDLVFILHNHISFFLMANTCTFCLRLSIIVFRCILIAIATKTKAKRKNGPSFESKPMYKNTHRNKHLLIRMYLVLEWLTQMKRNVKIGNEMLQLK